MSAASSAPLPRRRRWRPGWRATAGCGAIVLRRPVTRLLRLLHDAIPPPAPVLHFLEAHRPGMLMVAPMFGVGSIVPDYLRAANQLGIPTIALPVCWDDVSARAWPHVMPDCLALWNREQRRQAVQTLGIPARRTVILGAGLPLDIAGCDFDHARDLL